ncbi:MAG TPA: ABC transporter permease [Egibacteraceae bacterium]|nr:ABC transporter permease [Egibacteraceae bacterium]
MAAPTAKLGDLGRSRELLRNLVAKELKVRYKDSALGFVWSLLTPLLMTAVFTVVFATFLRIPLGQGNFATFFLAGYLAWQFFSNSVNASVGAIVGNGPLIRKVYFRREVLPLSIVLSQAVHFLLALAATLPIFAWFRGLHPQTLPAVAGGLVLLTLFTAGMSMLFAAANVGFRDLQELTQVIFLAWFYATPIIYPLFFVQQTAEARRFLPVLLANPMTWFVQLFQSALYGTPRGVGPNPGPTWPDAQTWTVCAAWALGALVLGYWLFDRLAVTFAKEV